MARTNVPIVTLSRTGAATTTGTVADTTNDHVVDLAGVPLEEIGFRFTNTHGSDPDGTVLIVLAASYAGTVVAERVPR